MLIFDIETTGLDPSRDRLRCVGTFETFTEQVELVIADRYEQELQLVIDLVSALETYDRWGGWNITEFDLWFLHERAAYYEMDFPIVATGETGKYGKPVWTSPLAASIDDLAYYRRFKEVAESRGIKHSLQPVATALGRPQAVALTGADMPGASITQVGAHCLDDLEAIRFLTLQSR